MELFGTNLTDEEKRMAIESDRPDTFTQFTQKTTLPKAISERHVACVFLLDVSGSMHRNDAILKLNDAMNNKFKVHMQSDDRIADVVDAAMISFGSTVTVLQDFRPVSEMEVPVLTANGPTPLGEALKKALDLINRRKEVYRSTGTPYFRPWIFCITDGSPTDDWHDAALELKQAEAANKVIARCVCIENDETFSKYEIKQIFDPNRILKLENLDFDGLFEFVSNSLTAVSQSTPGETKIDVSVPNTISLEI